jgi:uncharacterized membrane protein
VSRPFWSRRALRRHLIAGLVVIAPVTATVAVLWWIFQLLDGLLGRFLYPGLTRLFGRVPPGVGLISLVLLLLVVGWLAEMAVGSRVVSWWNGILERLPLTRTIYGAANRIVRTVLGEEARPFQKVVLVEYPSPGRWCMGFLAASAPDVVRMHVDDGVSVFIPTTPNPTSGFVVIIPRANVIEIPLTIDQAFTYILSAGSVRPGDVVAPPPDVPVPEPEPDGAAASQP